MAPIQASSPLGGLLAANASELSSLREDVRQKENELAVRATEIERLSRQSELLKEQLAKAPMIIRDRFY